ARADLDWGRGHGHSNEPNADSRRNGRDVVRVKCTEWETRDDRDLAARRLRLEPPRGAGQRVREMAVRVDDARVDVLGELRRALDAVERGAAGWHHVATRVHDECARNERIRRRRAPSGEQQWLCEGGRGDREDTYTHYEQRDIGETRTPRGQESRRVDE